MAFFLRVAVAGATRRGGGDVPPQPPQSTEPELEGLERIQDELRELGQEMPAVAVRALNKAMTGVKTDMVKIVRETHNFKAAALRKRLSVSKATRKNIQGHVQSKGRPFHLTDLAGTRQTARGVTVDVKKETGRQLIPRAFKAHGRHSGKEIVLIRAVQGGQMVPRYPVETRYAPHPEHVYNAPDTWARIEKAAAERLDTNIKREIDAEFRRLDGKW